MASNGNDGQHQGENSQRYRNDGEDSLVLAQSSHGFLPLLLECALPARLLIGGTILLLEIAQQLGQLLFKLFHPLRLSVSSLLLRGLLVRHDAAVMET